MEEDNAAGRAVYEILIVIGCAIALWLLQSIWNYFYTPSGKFWRLTGKFPELALILLSEEPDVIIQPPKVVVPKSHMGPFWIIDRGGLKWKIYVNRATIDEIQQRITAKILATSRFIPES